MKKIIIFQHVAHKILGTLHPTLKDHRLNIRYINFDRNPLEDPCIDKYNALIVLGGFMGVYEAERYRHIKTELKLIEQALKKDIPVLGICLGAQLIATVLGSTVRKHSVKEVGWHNISFTSEGLADKLFTHFKPSECLFQMHGDTFDIPDTAIQLAKSEMYNSQAFRYGNKVYGLQFHLEVDQASILRWLSYDSILNEINLSNGELSVEQIKNDTQLYIDRSIELSRMTFDNFVNQFDLVNKSTIIGSDHSKPLKKI